MNLAEKTPWFPSYLIMDDTIHQFFNIFEEKLENILMYLTSLYGLYVSAHYLKAHIACVCRKKNKWGLSGLIILIGFS